MIWCCSAAGSAAEYSSVIVQLHIKAAQRSGDVTLKHWEGIGEYTSYTSYTTSTYNPVVLNELFLKVNVRLVIPGSPILDISSMFTSNNTKLRQYEHIGTEFISASIKMLN